MEKQLQLHLLAAIFSKTKLDPTIINGGVLNSLKNSAKLGKSDWCILEADESDGSFVQCATNIFNYNKY